MKSSQPGPGRRGSGKDPSASLGRTEDDILTTAQVAQLLHVTPQTVIRFVKDGLITAHRLPGTRRFLFWRQDVVELMEANVFDPSQMDGTAEHSVKGAE